MTEQPGVYIDNAFGPGHGAKFVARDPATDEVIWSGKSAGKVDVHRAVQSARRAHMMAWSQYTVDERKEYLKKFADILKKRGDELARAISRETGKPLWESKTEVDVAVAKTDITIEAYTKRCAQEQEEVGEAVRFTRFKPHGVVAVLGPFNLPVHLPNGHILPALLAGNTVVFKPSEHTPMVGQAYAEYWKETGLPAGVLNMVQGGQETGRVLVDQADLDGLFFTGSFRTGSAIHQAWAGQPEKILALEMGGNNPLIVDQVKDILAACYMTIQSAFITSGQRCTCARRLIVIRQENTGEFLSALTAMTRAVLVGGYWQEPQPFMGTMINKWAARNILNVQQTLIQQGGKPLLKCVNIDGKAMLSPGLIDVTDVKNREDEEIFGPLLQIVMVDDLDEAIGEANRTAYGLAAGILSDWRESYERFYQFSRCGVVSWNRPMTGASSRGPFGGVGKSGNFRPSAYFAADYCSYPVATIEMEHLSLPETLNPGITI